MNMIAKEIKEYWYAKSKGFSFDAETLDLVSRTLSPEEVASLEMGAAASKALGGETWERYIFTVNKAFNRHNDIVCRYTTIGPNDTVLCSKRSSITELDIKISTLLNCNQNCIYHIGDYEKEILPNLTLDSIVDLTRAIILYNQEHSEEAR